MDPDANLAEQRSIAADVMRIWDAADPDTGALNEEQQLALVHYAHELAELAQALDEWITGGGFLPAVWRRASASNLR